LRDITRRRTLRISVLGLTALTVGLMVAHADVVQSTVTLPPPTGVYTLGDSCISSADRCVENASVSNFSVISDSQVAGNEVIMATAGFSGEVTTDNGGSPGTPIGPVSLDGTVEITYVGRNPSINPLGDFTTLVPSFDFKGIFNGKTFELKQNPSMASMGTTSILETTFTPPILYTVSSELELFGEFSINGGPFTPGPGKTTTLTSVPEPGYWGVAAGLLAGVPTMRRRRQGALR
jgi:hypothetical protein